MDFDTKVCNIIGVPKKGKRTPGLLWGYFLQNNWGTKKRKKDSKTLMGLFFANNIYLKQIYL
jgi:hypothetical protein